MGQAERARERNRMTTDVCGGGENSDIVSGETTPPATVVGAGTVVDAGTSQDFLQRSPTSDKWTRMWGHRVEEHLLHEEWGAGRGVGVWACTCYWENACYSRFGGLVFFLARCQSPELSGIFRTLLSSRAASSKS